MPTRRALVLTIFAYGQWVFHAIALPGGQPRAWMYRHRLLTHAHISSVPLGLLPGLTDSESLLASSITVKESGRSVIRLDIVIANSEMLCVLQEGQDYARRWRSHISSLADPMALILVVQMIDPRYLRFDRAHLVRVKIQELVLGF